MCDGKSDCSNKPNNYLIDDENSELCANVTNRCGVDRFSVYVFSQLFSKFFFLQCNSGQCIDKTLVCDGQNQCPDGSDENAVTCPCGKDNFQCESDGTCVPTSALCDGTADCADRSDEQRGVCVRKCGFGYLTVNAFSKAAF